jgi:hypothetical protein
MPTYKLNITYEIDGSNTIGEDEGINASHLAHIILLEQHTHGLQVQASLTREGDRSGANLLAPINDRHFKHTKISLDEYMDSKPGLREAMNNDQD